MLDYLMYDGDNLRVTIHDTSQGLLTRVDDLTRGTSGFMVASAIAQTVSAASVITAKTAIGLFTRNLLALKIGIGPHSLLAKLVRIPRKHNKPTWQNTRRYSVTSAYL